VDFQRVKGLRRAGQQKTPFGGIIAYPPRDTAKPAKQGAAERTVQQENRVESRGGEFFQEPHFSGYPELRAFLVKSDKPLYVRVTLQDGKTSRREYAGNPALREYPAQIGDHGGGKQNVPQPIHVEKRYLPGLAWPPPIIRVHLIYACVRV
jgi:hypothetical protein